MSNVNLYTVTGRVLRPVLVSKTNTGVPFCSATLVIPGNATIEVTAFGPTADVLAQAKVGQSVLVSGPVVSNQWTSRDGVQRQKFSIRADSVGLATEAG